MRLRSLLLPLAIALGGASAGAQPAADSLRPAGAPPAAPAAAVETAGVRPAQAAPLDATIVERAERFERTASWFPLPATPGEGDRGPRTVAAGERVAGDVAVLGGPLDVHGTVTGSAVVYGGDLVVHPGGSIAGDAVAVLGRVRLAGGTVGGEIRSVRGSLEPAPAAPAPSAVATMSGQLGLVVGWFAVLALMGLGVLVFAGGPLEGVVERLERGFGASLAAGIVGQIALAPALLLLIVALAITIIGALLIPFAIVGYVIAAAGLMTLGFLAVARVIGGAISGRRGAGRLTERGAALRGLVLGVAALTAVWLLAALLATLPTAALVARGLAFAVTWAAVTAGFGAAILSRAGTRRGGGPAAPEPAPVEEEISWQTPTPIGGVVAARRPASGAPR
jgi:hypothetical protein